MAPEALGEVSSGDGPASRLRPRVQAISSDLPTLIVAQREVLTMKFRHALYALVAGTMLATPAFAVDLAIVSGDHRQRPAGAARDARPVREGDRQQGHRSCRCRPRPPTSSRQYKLWLAAQNSDIDVYQTDVIWAPQLANQLVDLTDATKDVDRRPFPVDHRIADRQRQARRAADLHRRAGALLPQGPPRQIRRQGADDLEGDGRHRQDGHGQGAGGRQQGHVGLRLPGQLL